MQLTKLRAAPVLRAEVPPCASCGRMDGGTASQLIRSVRQTMPLNPQPQPTYPWGSRMPMRSFNFVVERDPDTGLFVGHIPGWPGAHSQGESLDELQRNLQEVVSMLLEHGEPRLESEFVGVQTIKVA
jgi:predicted RNase H-like HicB family nuclease